MTPPRPHAPSRRAQACGRPARDRSDPRLRARRLGPQRKTRRPRPLDGNRLASYLRAAARSPRLRGSRRSTTRSATSRPPFATVDAQPPRRRAALSRPSPIRDKQRAPMNLALRKPMTLAEFLEWEERQPLRYEFDGVGPVAMTGGTAGHADIQRNLAIAAGWTPSRQAVPLLRQRPQISGRGGPRPLSRRHGRLLPGRSNRDRRL